jgi:predicted nucleotidyltransferase
MRKPEDATVNGVDVDGMVDYLARTDVVFAVLFGSHARGSAEASSDVDVALAFPDEMDAAERFHRRNRIDADLQAYADNFVDVSDVDSLPVGVVRAALRDRVLLVGDAERVESHQKQVDAEYESTERERERERQEFIDRLARGDV